VHFIRVKTKKREIRKEGQEREGKKRGKLYRRQRELKD